MYLHKEEILDLRRRVLNKEYARMNGRQKEAVFTSDGPLLILAGAGSGKTTVVVNRIAYLIRYGKAYDSTYIQGEIGEKEIYEMENFLKGGERVSDETAEKLAVSPCPPWKILAITFTNKAAGELKERLTKVVGEKGNEVWASTFHSSCARILRKDAEKIGYSSHFTIYDSDDSKRVMKDVLKSLNISDKMMPVKSVLNEISRAKDSLISPYEFKRNSGSDYRLKIIADCYEAYEKRLKDSGAMDFDDLIVKTVELFKTNPDVLEYYQNRFRYLCVDEYQDTNHAQYELVRLIAEKNGNICVVGDDDQSIYKFRGATIENIMSFEKSFPGAKVIKLEQNYRSTQNILDAANSVIDNNTQRKGKSLWTDNGEGSKITLHTAENEQDEADKVATEILKMVAEGKKFSDFAILYRMNSQSLSFERMFAKQGIPHRIIGGLRFYERAEIKDMLAYLSLVNNPDDEVRLKRIVNSPKRGIGDRTVELLSEIASQLGESMFSLMGHAEDFPMISKAAKKLKEFYNFIVSLQEISESESGTMADLYEAIVEGTDYESYLKQTEPEKFEDKISNVQELLNNIKRYEEENSGTLSDFLEEIALITDIDNFDTSADSVVLMTVHSAKGLEFPVVFLPGWEESVFPGNSAIYNPEEIEEERRLAYVAITRAKEKLYILNATTRMVFGTTQRNRLSRFAEEIPSRLIEKTEARKFGSFGTAVKTNGTVFRSTASNSMSNLNIPVVSAPGIRKPVSAASSGSFKIGDKVSHKTFGSGMILSVTPMGNDTLLEIAFEKVGTKKLFQNFAKLTKE